MQEGFLQYGEITEKIIGCAMKVHRFFGSGFPEIIYKRALRIELEKINLIIHLKLKRIFIMKTALSGKED